MSAICGVFERGGAAAGLAGADNAAQAFAPRALAAMMPVLAPYGPDGAAVWQAGAVGFGQQMLGVTPESRHEILPWHDAAAALAITAHARLDNRAELCQTLDIPTAERSYWPDSRLILRAYEKWGADCPAHLLGDFAFAIWDERQRRLFCCRDHTGVYPFFYVHAGRRFVFASRIEALLAVPGVARRLNRARLAALASKAARFVQHEQTFFEGVLSLPAATSLLVDEAGLRQQVYWHPENAPALPYRSDAELLEALRALLFEVVGARLRSAFPVAALLSGGLDSSGLVALAARWLAERGQTLLTFSSVLPERHTPGLTDERAFIDEFRDWPNLKLQYFSAPGCGPFDDLEKLVRDYEAPLLSTAHYLHTAFAQAARAANARIVLHGIHGEQGPTNYGEGYYAELFLRGRWPTLWRELAACSRVENKARRAVFRAQVWPWLRPPSVRAPPLPPALQPEFVRQHLVPAERDDMRRWHWPSPRRAQLRMIQNLLRKHARGGDGVYPGPAPLVYGLPYRDKRLLEFCLNAPTHLKLRNGYARSLLRAGLDGLLPPKIQWRTDKQPFAPDYHERYRAQQPFAQAFLADIAPNDPVRAVVAVERLKELAALAQPRDPDAVPLGIYLLTFLRQFAEFRS